MNRTSLTWNWLQVRIQGKSHPIIDVTLPSSDSMNSAHQLSSGCNLVMRVPGTFSNQETYNIKLLKQQINPGMEVSSNIQRDPSSACLWGQKEEDNS